MSTDIDDPGLATRIAGFVNDAIMPIAAAMARGDGPSPERIVEAAGEAGLAGILTPETFGGAGGSHGDFIQLIEAVARADASCAVILDVHLSVGTEPLLVFGNDDQKSRYLRKLATRRMARGLRADRGCRRERCDSDAHPRAARRRHLRSRRCQGLHHRRG